MPNMPPGGENKSSMKGEAKTRKSSGSGKVAGIEDHSSAGEKGSQGGVVFKIPEYIDHSCVRTPEHKQMAFKFPEGNQKAFSGRENTSSGKPKEAFDLTSGAKQVGKILGAGEPGKASGFRPGGHGPGYNYVGGKEGMQVKIPNTRDQSNVHSCKGVDPADITQSDSTVNPTHNNA